MQKHNKTILLLSLPLALLVIIVSVFPMLNPGYYALETNNWKAQSVGQDLIDLYLIVPALLLTSLLAYRQGGYTTFLWGGVVLYLTYTFTLYCFDVHFTSLFVLYCVCLGLSFYAFTFFIITQYKHYAGKQVERTRIIQITAIYFLILPVFFYLLWLAEIIPAILNHSRPKSVIDAGLFTNGVHVLDLSIVLPGVFITGLLLLKRSGTGTWLAPAILMFFVLMDVTIGALVLVMQKHGVGGDIALTFVMSGMALVSLALLTAFLRTVKMPLEDTHKQE